MGWRNIAFSGLDDAAKAIEEARRVLNDQMEPIGRESFVLAVLAAQEALGCALNVIVSDGVTLLAKPVGDIERTGCKCLFVDEQRWAHPGCFAFHDRPGVGIASDDRKHFKVPDSEHPGFLKTVNDPRKQT
jgi:hypothetical protein